MKTKDVDALVSMVRELARALEDPWAIGRLHWVMLSLIELAREGKAYKALDVAFETNAYLCIMAEKAQKDLKAAQAGTPVGIVGEKNVWWKAGEINIRTTQPSVAGYVGIRNDAPKPVATVEQMRAAADAAMASDDDLTEWTCDVCRKKTLTESMITPIGWSRTLNSNTGKALYACNECQMFGIKNDAHVHDGAFTCSGCSLRSWTADGKGPLGWVFNTEVDGKFYKVLCTACFGTGILKQYNCRDCDSTTGSRVHPAPGWTDVGDGEFICFACAEEEAEP